MKILSRLAFATLAIMPVRQAAGDNATPSVRVVLPGAEIRKTHPPYADYCARHPEHCDLSGPTRVAFDPVLPSRL